MACTAQCSSPSTAKQDPVLTNAAMLDKSQQCDLMSDISLDQTVQVRAERASLAAVAPGHADANDESETLL